MRHDPSGLRAAALRRSLLTVAAASMVACGGSDARLEPRFVAVHNTMAALGFAQTGSISQGSLQEGDDVRVIVPLRANGCTVFLALGSSGLDDLEVVVLDTNGTTVGEDATVDNQAAVRVCPMTPGDYAVVIRAAEGSGSYSLASWSAGPAGSPGAAVAAGGGGGSCDDPFVLTAGSPINGSTAGGATATEGTCAQGASPERVYVLDVEERLQLNVVLESDYDGALYLRRSCFDPQSEVACNDDSPNDNTRRSQITATIDPGRYYLVVDGYGGESGGYQLLATTAPLRPLADVCDDAEAVSPGQVVNGTTASSSDYFQATCAGGARSPDRVYSVEVRQRSRLRVRQQSNHDGALHLRRVCAEPTTEMACNDDFVDPRRSHVKALVDPGQYFLVADGYGEAAAGSYSFTADLAPEAGSGGPADACDDPAPLAPNGLGAPDAPSVASADTFRLRDDLAGSCGGQGGADAVYVVDVASRGIFSARVGETELDGAVYLRRGTCDDASAELACAPVTYAQGGTLRTVVRPGRHYLVLDGANAAQFGSAKIEASLEDLAPVERACRRPERLRTGRTVNGSTADGNALFAASCADGAASPEKLYSLRLRRRSRVRIEVESQYDAALHVRSDCVDPSTEVACNDDHQDNRHAMIEQVFDAGTYTVFVDGYREGNEGDFTLSVTVTEL